MMERLYSTKGSGVGEPGTGRRREGTGVWSRETGRREETGVWSRETGRREGTGDRDRETGRKEKKETGSGDWKLMTGRRREGTGVWSRETA
jgi:hypothetical protein